MDEFIGLIIVFGFCAILIFCGYKINDDENTLLKTNAVKSGAAEWVTDDSGNTTFKWKKEELNKSE